MTVASDMSLANAAGSIKFKHIPTGQEVRFLAFLTEFADSYESKWNSEEVYGRMDPIMTFSNTVRKITIGWDVVAGSALEAFENMQNISKLVRFQYPVYEGGRTLAAGPGRTLAAGPLLRLKFMNWAINATNTTEGLVGTMAGLSFKPIIEEGFYDGPDTSLENVAISPFHDKQKPALLPKAVTLSCTFTVLHTHLMGWELADTGKNREIRDPFSGPDGKAGSFPYNISPAVAIVPATDQDANPAAAAEPYENYDPAAAQAAVQITGDEPPGAGISPASLDAGRYSKFDVGNF